MHVVLINGPAGAGKTYFANALRTELFSVLRKNRLIPPSGVLSVLHCGFKEPLREMLFQFAESAGVLDFAHRSEDAYVKLKETNICGLLGREWQIVWGESMRAKDIDIFSKILWSRLCNILPQIAVVDDLGFEHEYSFIKEVTRREDRFTTFYLDQRDGTAAYNHGQRFRNDSRICLRDNAELANPRVEAAAAYIVGEMLTAAQPSLNF